MISILIPLYNHENYIGTCLDSILQDDYPCKEILIIDDGSKDASSDVARRWYEENRQRFDGRFELVRRENRGLTRTLNELVAMALGEFAVVIASDDYLLPGGLQSRVDYLRAQERKMAVFGDCIVVDENGLKTGDSGVEGLYRGKKSRLGHATLVSYELVFHWCVPGPVFMARRSLFDLIGGYNEKLAVEDWDFYLRLAARDLVGFVDFPVAAYRVHSKSFIRSPERSRAYNLSMLETVITNYPSFSGIRRLYLIGERLKLMAIIAREQGDLTLKNFFVRKAGRFLLFLAKRLYHLLVPLIRLK